MTGITLGGESGATLGTEDGGTLGGGWTQWVVGPHIIDFPTDETATHDALTLSFRVSRSTLVDHLRDLKANEGQVDVLTTDSGGFVAVDRADGANTFAVTPPNTRDPLRQAGSYLVRRYEEDLVSQSVDEWDVTLELVPDANRVDEPSIDEVQFGAAFPMTFDATFGPKQWAFETRFGTIVTGSVDAEFIGTGADGVERFELSMRLTFAQAHALEAALSRLEGVRVRHVPDATNRALDDTDGDNTLGIDTPTEDVVPTGEYVAIEFESRRLNDAYQYVTLEVASAD